MRLKLAGEWKDPSLKAVFWWAWGAGFMTCVALEVVVAVWAGWWFYGR